MADATTLLFAAPLFVTVLSIAILGEKIGILRVTAVTIGFDGVLIMQRPWVDNASLDASRLVLLLPVLVALNQLMIRKLGVESEASALLVYIRAAFIAVSLEFYLIAGTGRFAAGAARGDGDRPRLNAPTIGRPAGYQPTHYIYGPTEACKSTWGCTRQTKGLGGTRPHDVRLAIRTCRNGRFQDLCKAADRR